MPFTHYRTKGIFLKKEDRGEADQVFTLFTENFGKISVRAKAIRKITSKLRSGADVFYFSEIEFIQAKHYKILTDAVLIDRFKYLRQSPERLKAAYKIADAVDCLVDEGDGDEKIWHLLTQTLRAWGGSDPPSFWEGQTLPYFFWNLCSLLGYGPELYNCACCGKKLLPETLFFVPQEGGVVCWQCCKKKNLTSELGCEVSVGTIKILRFLLKESLDMVGRLRIAEPEQGNLRDVSGLYLDFLKQVSNIHS